MTFGNRIDEVILQHSTRGMDIIQANVPVAHCARASEVLLALPKGTIFLYTGFYVAGHAETDGPVGTYFLARALKTLGYSPLIITDEFCRDFFKEIDTLYMPIEGYANDEGYEEILHQYEPVAHISIERCGVNLEGKYANMRGVDIGPFTAPVDKLFVLGGKRAPTFAVGDGGNEIGMGNFKEIITEKLSLNPCVITCDHPIIASVSNWGAYGIIAFLEMFYERTLLPTFSEADAYLAYIVSLGSVDGVKGENVMSVDGKEWEIEAQILNDLKAAVIDHQNDFGMSSDYDEHSKSQHHIGGRLIEMLLPFVDSENATCLDIGCGPGALTEKLRTALKEKKLKVIGMDIDHAIIAQAKESFPECDFMVGSFYEDPQSHRSYEYIFSNEALHWTPKIPERFHDKEGILYTFFDEEAQRAYREWGLSCMENSFAYIADKLASHAVMQFGLQGQLQDVYALINTILHRHYAVHAAKVKFPLFYPAYEEVLTLCAKHGLEVIEASHREEDLYEQSKEEIVAFIRAFTQNYLRSVLSPEEVEQFYRHLADEISDPDALRKAQWQRLILVLKPKQKQA